jgi:hypothetical protein
MPTTMAGSTERFWSDVRRRRNHFFYWWLGWIPFGFIALVVLESALGSAPPVALMWATLLIWFTAWGAIAFRLLRLRCPRCNEPAISQPLFFMRHAKCQHCGLKQGDAYVP